MRQDKSAAERVEEMIKETQNSNKKVHVRRRSIDLQLAIQSEDTDNVALQAINKARRMSLTEVMTESKRDLLKQEDEKQKGNLVKKISLSRMAQLKVKIKMIGKMALLMKNERIRAEEKLRVERIGKNWAIVRRIARASLAMIAISSTFKESLSGEAAGFQNYDEFLKTIDKSIYARSEADVQRIQSVLKRLDFFKKVWKSSPTGTLPENNARSV